MGNGVNAEFFSPRADRPSPFAADELPLVFTGAMDYWPNVDAVCWFAANVMPGLRQRFTNLRLHIVGRSPTAAVKALQSDTVSVTGTVPDVRPYLQHAAVVVPLPGGQQVPPGQPRQRHPLLCGRFRGASIRGLARLVPRPQKRGGTVNHSGIAGRFQHPGFEMAYERLDLARRFLGKERWP